MKAQRISWWRYLVLAIVALCAGLIFSTWTLRKNGILMGAPWYLSASILGVGLVVTWSAWQVRRFVEGKIHNMPAQRSVNTLIFAQSMALSASAMIGWYGAIICIAIQHAEIPYFSSLLWQVALAFCACLIDLILGILSEFWCVLPPQDRKDNE